jgi:hypothetical protein
MNDKLKFREEQIKVLKSQKTEFESALAILTQETSGLCFFLCVDMILTFDLC